MAQAKIVESSNYALVATLAALPGDSLQPSYASLLVQAFVPRCFTVSFAGAIAHIHKLCLQLFCNHYADNSLGSSNVYQRQIDAFRHQCLASKTAHQLVPLLISPSYF